MSGSAFRKKDHCQAAKTTDRNINISSVHHDLEMQKRNYCCGSCRSQTRKYLENWELVSTDKLIQVCLMLRGKKVNPFNANDVLNSGSSNTCARSKCNHVRGNFQQYWTWNELMRPPLAGALYWSSITALHWLNNIRSAGGTDITDDRLRINEVRCRPVTRPLTWMCSRTHRQSFLSRGSFPARVALNTGRQ